MSDFSFAFEQDGFFDEIVQILHEETGQHVNVMGDKGVIIASTRKERIGTVHESARQIMAGLIEEALVTEEEAAKLEGVRAGANLPIVYEGKRIGVIGMTGDPNIVKPIVRVASRTVVLWLKNHEQMNKQKVAAEEVYGQLQNMAATIEELAASSEDFASSSKQASNEVVNAGNQVKEISVALRIIREIASQSKMIGLNAAIEAARAGKREEDSQ
ncbi:sugar diacid recognition domain-containing protein [Tepidibacillus marianensis]|uniref:sugar diacid recognition domain-containing protein n=1 Tax=Tepidibacillus marianensis TaxID=3131995 RepID=UPI0030D03FF9